MERCGGVLPEMLQVPGLKHLHNGFSNGFRLEYKAPPQDVARLNSTALMLRTQEVQSRDRRWALAVGWPFCLCYMYLTTMSRVETGVGCQRAGKQGVGS